MRILQHGQFLREFFFSHAERDRVGSRKGQRRQARQGRRLAPAFRSKRNIRRELRCSPQVNLRSALRAQVPPHTVNACLDFARRRIGIGIFLCLAWLFGL